MDPKNEKAHPTVKLFAIIAVVFCIFIGYMVENTTFAVIALYIVSIIAAPFIACGLFWLGKWALIGMLYPFTKKK